MNNCLTDNMFWPVYKDLEEEILKLTYIIHFSDSQFEYIKEDGKMPVATDKLEKKSEYMKTPVYSLKIADLLIRCCVEIEALTKKMTQNIDEDVKSTPNTDKTKPLNTGSRLKYLNQCQQVKD